MAWINLIEPRLVRDQCERRRSGVPVDGSKALMKLEPHGHQGHRRGRRQTEIALAIMAGRSLF